MSAPGRCIPQLLGCVLVVGMLTASPAAQSGPPQRTLPYSKAEVEDALRSLQANTGGRLPILDGFVTSDSSLDHYQHPFYQYSVQVTSTAAHSSVVRVSARITAWYADPIPAHSGYRLLASNGRLEADLLDRLAESLAGKTEASSPPVAVPDAVTGTEKPAATPSSSVVVPAGPSRPSLPLPRFGRPELPPRQTAGQPSRDDKHIQELSEQAKNLEQILRNQSRPENLAVVKNAHAPILERPEDSAKVLFEADAEDEFQIVDANDAWVHVQISGLSRGWIRRSDLQLPAAYENRTATAAPSGPLQPFHQTRQETAAFPGSWEPLRGKQVKVVWVQPSGGKSTTFDKFSYAKSVFRGTFPELLKSSPPLAGVVVVFDSEDGGMAAATLATLQQWNAHHMTDSNFWKQCWFDPADAFKVKE